MRSVADVRRPQETRGRLAAVTMVYPASTVRVWLEIRALKRLQTSFGAGEEATGTMEAETHAGADIQRNDVLEVIAGPEAGTKWSVEGVHAPGDGSLLLALSVFNGDLPLPPAP